MKMLKWGVIAAGGIADRRMIPAMAASSEAEIVAVMDSDAGKAREVALKYGVPCWYDNAEALLNMREIEAVYIASPVYCHKEQVFAAADAGKHILLEKPLALNAAEAREMVDYCKTRGILFAAGFNMRFATLHQKLKTLLEEGCIGQLVSVDAQFTCWYPEIEGAWRQKKALSGGGALMDMGIHLIDLTQYLTGSRIVKVAALNERIRFSYEVEDSSSLLVRFDNGMTGNIRANFNIPDSAARWQICFFGTKGRIIGDTTIGQEDGGRLLAICEDSEKGYDAQQNAADAKEQVITAEYGDLFGFELHSFTDSLLNGKPLVCDAEQAVYDHMVADAAYLSSETGRFVDIKPV
jgi:predicted dehydrogenase